MGHYRTYPAGHVKHFVSNTLINLGARYAVYDICSLQSAVCTLQIGSLRYGDYGLRTTVGRALSFVRSTGLSRASIER